MGSTIVEAAKSDLSQMEVGIITAEIRRLQQQFYLPQIKHYRYRCLRKGGQEAGGLMTKKVIPRDEEVNLSPAVVETIIKSAKRRLTSNDSRFITPADLCVIRDEGDLPQELCLLVDTSGSMNGKRLQEVKLLANQLLREMHEPLSLITFQENAVEVKVRTTRRAVLVRAGLQAMRAYGLTPLGEGIRVTVNYLQQRRGKKHLVVLITDGLPTWAKDYCDPFLDALEAAELIKQKKIRLVCIGLEPQRDFLEKLAQVADASLYLVEDLNHSELATITRRERRRLAKEENW